MAGLLPGFQFCNKWPSTIFVLDCSLTKNLYGIKKFLLPSVVKWMFLKCHVLTFVRCLQIFLMLFHLNIDKEVRYLKRADYLALDLQGVLIGGPALGLGKSQFFQLWGRSFNTVHSPPPLCTSELLPSSHGLRQLSGLSDNIWTAVRFLPSSSLPQTLFNSPLSPRGSSSMLLSSSCSVFLARHLPGLFHIWDTLNNLFLASAPKPIRASKQSPKNLLSIKQTAWLKPLLIVVSHLSDLQMNLYLRSHKMFSWKGPWRPFSSAPSKCGSELRGKSKTSGGWIVRSSPYAQQWSTPCSLHLSFTAKISSNNVTIYAGFCFKVNKFNINPSHHPEMMVNMILCT